MRARPNLDTGLFKDVRRFELFAKTRDYSALTPNDFELAYFPDIGMTVESIFLSNMRLAPIQVTNYGHPVSTWGSQIDYWIGGEETEVPENAASNYSERLVLIPGCGQISTRPHYQPKGLQPAPAPAPIRVGCCWTGQKINVHHLRLLRRAADRSARPVRFVFFPGAAAFHNGFLPLKRDIVEVLGERAEVNGHLPYDRYMGMLEQCHFAADAYPFGGYNSAVDVLYLRKPLVVLRGDRFYNMASAYLLRRMGLDEVIADTPDAFVDLLARMIDDDDFRERMAGQAARADVDRTVLSHENAVHFRSAIRYLVDNHAALKKDKSRAPIHIGARAEGTAGAPRFTAKEFV
jgi:hypothetical protein